MTQTLTIEQQISFIDAQLNGEELALRNVNGLLLRDTSRSSVLEAIRKNLIFVRDWNLANGPKQPTHYAPLRPGNNSGEIVTDVSTYTEESRLDMDKEIGYYGGFLVAESIPSVRLRDQIIEAYNDYYLPKVSGVSKATVNNIGNGQR